MQSVRLDYYNPKKTIIANPQNITESILLAIDRFLVFISKHKPNILETYISDLIKIFGAAIPLNYKNHHGFDLSNIESSSTFLKRYPELIKVSIDLILSLLKTSEDYDWNPNEISILRTDLARTNLLQFYYRAKLLTEVLAYDDAIQILKDYIDKTIEDQEVEQFEDLDSFFKNQEQTSKEQEDSIWSFMKISNGKYASRTDRCVPYMIMKDFNDPELSYIVACYGDFARAGKFNKNFVLTRTTTLMNGPFCDTCLHDSRYVEKIEHPPMDFFKKI